MSESQNREIAVFGAALELPADQRGAYLDQACEGDADLRQQVEALLRVHDDAGSFFDKLAPVARPTSAEGAMAGSSDAVHLPAIPVEKTGDLIGRYKLLEKIGEGGMGVVYMAQQEEPVRRKVALKIIKLGMDTQQVVARFQAERQALALMDHPNIAKVLDAGATDTGRPYFVMELVQGVPITEFCDKNRLPAEERIKLFIQICQAIQSAHQKGIIHRDIKPTNILVTLNACVPYPLVIDFGVAKATQQKLTEKTLFTNYATMIGTPAYTSPEQAEMSRLDVDTRADIYGLGVLLYELLTGTTPFPEKRLRSVSYKEMQRIIMEEEPERPSTRLTALTGEQNSIVTRNRGGTELTEGNEGKRIGMVARNRGASRVIAGDLDWIVMKCLEKDRTRRYETANGLAADLKRHLDNEPVVARPPSNLYRFQKLVRRNKLAFTALTAVAVATLVGLAVSTFLFIQERRAHDRALAAETMAEKRLDESEAISKFLTEVFQSPDPARDGRSITVAEALSNAAIKLETDLTNQPARRAKLQSTLGLTYYALGLYREAIPLQEKVRDYYRANSGPEHTNTIIAMNNLANSYSNASRHDEALKLREEVLALCRKVKGPEHPDTLKAMHNLATSYYLARRQEEAIKLREEVLALRREVLSPEHPDTLIAMNNLAVSYDQAGRLDEALKLREEALAMFRKVSGTEKPNTLTAMGNLANSYQEAGRHDEAIKLREEVLVLSRKVNGPEHPDTLRAIINLANSYNEAGRWKEALKLMEEALPLSRKFNGPEHLNTLIAMDNLANSYYKAGRWEEAAKLLEEALPLSRKLNGPEHSDTLWVMNTLVDSYFSTGRSGQAITLLAEAEPKNTDASLALAAWQTWFGQDADYEATRRRLIQQAEGTAQAGTAERAAKSACLRASTDAAMLTKALSLAQRAVELGKSNPDLPWYQLCLGLAEYRNSQYAAAERTLTIAEQTAGDKNDIPGIARLFRAMSLFRQDKAEEARKLFGQAEAQMPPLPKDENKPLLDGKPVSHDVLICWLAYKEAKAIIEGP